MPLVRRHPVLKSIPSPVSTEAPGAGVPDEGSTKDEIKEYLDAKGIEHTSRMTKDDLLELI